MHDDNDTDFLTLLHNEQTIHTAQLLLSDLIYRSDSTFDPLNAALAASLAINNFRIDSDLTGFFRWLTDDARYDCDEGFCPRLIDALSRYTALHN